jgi:hypothetical protein
MRIQRSSLSRNEAAEDPQLTQIAQIMTGKDVVAWSINGHGTVSLSLEWRGMIFLCPLRKAACSANFIWVVRGGPIGRWRTTCFLQRV